VTFLAEAEAATAQLAEKRAVWQPATPTDRIHAFRTLIASLPEAPAAPLAAFDRENLYP
jgi:hypothetical protein